jgi:hypothetical protein
MDGTRKQHNANSEFSNVLSNVNGNGVYLHILTIPYLFNKFSLLLDRFTQMWKEIQFTKM